MQRPPARSRAVPVSLDTGMCPPRSAGSPLAWGSAANLPSHARVKFLALEGSEPVAETMWSETITLKRGTAAPQPLGAGGHGVVPGGCCTLSTSGLGCSAPVSSWGN